MKIGDKIEIPASMPILHTQLRWKAPFEHLTSLHEGRFIVDELTQEFVDLADADWNADGRITFHSSKHGHRLPIQVLDELEEFVVA